MVATGVDAASDDARLADAKARVGTTLRGKWRLDALLGLGGMAAVYAATHRNGIRGAVKMLDPVISRNDAMRGRFLREGYLANSVDHPAAVLVLDDDTTEDGLVYLVMELLEGSTLEELAAASEGKLPPREVVAAMAQLLDALSHAHARGIVHRDIKPDNLFLTATGAVKVLDFGIARLLESELALSVTQTGSPMGTPAFMSPEQARGRSKAVDGQSDVYSVGATMFTLLSGELVHGKDVTISEYVAATFTTQARSLATVAPEVPAPIVAVVDRALRLEKTERWPSAAAMLAALKDAYAASFGEPLPEPSAPVPRSGRSSLVSLHELKSLTPVSTRPRSHSDAAPTIPPPSSQPPPAKRGKPLVIVAGALVASAAAVTVWHFRGKNEIPTERVSAAVVSVHETTAQPVQTSAPVTPPPVTRPIETATASTQAAPRSQRVQKPVAKTAATATPKATASPSASAAPAPTVDLYDRRY